MAELDRTLYVRADAALIEALDARLARENGERRGVKITRADLVRSLLWERLEALIAMESAA